MKYQSEIVNEILEKRGHGKSSLHYQSECIKAWIEEARPSYPKLCDYEGEWLNYINKHETIGKFPYISLTDVTEATVNNVVPYEYKSAILKGNTDENLQSVKMPVLTTTGKNIIDGEFKPGTTNWNITTFPWFNDANLGSATRAYLDKPLNLISGKKYTISCINPIYGFAVHERILGNTDKNDSGWKMNKPYTFTATNNCYALYVRKNDDSIIKTQDELKEIYNSIMIEEGETATSYEPFKSNILTVNEDVTLRSNGSVYDELDLLTGKLTQRIDEDGSVLTQEVVKTVDLNVEDQDGNTLSKIKPIEGTMHISTDGNPIKPTFTGEVPIEAITQNLASFIEE